LCPKSILPGMWWKYIEEIYTDRNGNKATRLAKVHAYHKVKH